jgi:protein AroM
MGKTIGVITIGQTPRVDLIPEVKKFFTEETEIIERGVLDNKTKAELKELEPDTGQGTLVSRLRDGNKAIMAKEKILPIIQELIDELNFLKVDVILLACTGKFNDFQSEIPVIYPDYLLNYAVKGLIKRGEIGVIMPLVDQGDTMVEKWKEVDLHAITAVASPYDFSETELIRATEQLNQQPVKVIILDCMGYTEKMKAIVQEKTDKPVLLSRNVTFKLTAELF